jgi:DNA adenine methylase
LNNLKIHLNDKDFVASPILKWAGGKTQLLPVLQENFPKQLVEGKVDTYIEPFVGGGAVFFDIARRFNFKRAYLFDINFELVILYNSLKQDVTKVIAELSKFSDTYLSKETGERQQYFYSIREEYNNEFAITHKALEHSSFNARRSAMTIFLNRTCFNGLFRVNKKGGFNVPYGRYKNPTILFEGKLRAASAVLQNAEIMLGDFSDCKKYISGKTFIYYDPPYRPVSKTSSFNSYSREEFNDDSQKRLASFYKKVGGDNVFQLLSNSDPCNYVEDLFFDELYNGFSIIRVDATRRINSNATKRGILKEILVKDY